MVSQVNSFKFSLWQREGSVSCVYINGININWHYLGHVFLRGTQEMAHVPFATT